MPAEQIKSLHDQDMKEIIVQRARQFKPTILLTLPTKSWSFLDLMSMALPNRALITAMMEKWLSPLLILPFPRI
jgi:hypothetical protein